MDSHQSPFIDEARIAQTLQAAAAGPLDPQRLKDVLAKALELKGLDASDVAVLSQVSSPDQAAELFAAASRVKDSIYGSRLVLFAPLYVSNLCANECQYCAFRANNAELKRRVLSQSEVAAEVKTLVEQGHKRVLLVAGESYPRRGFDYVLDCITTVYATRLGKGEIRRVNVNVAPLEIEQFKRLKEARIGTYQLFQETYHRETYARVHLAGKKVDYDWRVTVMDRAMEAGIDDVGIGVLFGLADWRFELQGLLQHIRHLEQAFGCGPHTISVPRIEPAVGSPMAFAPPSQVSDDDFKRIVAILRLAVPYTGLILSTRENAETRRACFALGVSQISAGSRTNPGGYQEQQDDVAAQFCLGDHREIDEVVRDVASMGYLPSFCTACYRLGRTGADFMELAKPGEIKYHCDPNALSTFQEYLADYATPQTREIGEALIAKTLEKMDAKQREVSTKLLEKVKAGRRDVCC
ncbi:MAG TPA: [FeFe] hydrogenase H-cluster radical SAM maturase HydG [Myxococcales bacterium]|jgi:2-iminoacetate synthase